MDHERMRKPDPLTDPPFWRSRYGLGLIVFGAVAGYFLLAEHKAHLLGALPFMLLLACPLVHFSMHRGHGGRHDHTSRRASSQQPSPERGDQP